MQQHGVAGSQFTVQFHLPAADFLFGQLFCNRNKIMSTKIHHLKVYNSLSFSNLQGHARASWFLQFIFTMWVRIRVMLLNTVIRLLHFSYRWERAVVKFNGQKTLLRKLKDKSLAWRSICKVHIWYRTYIKRARTVKIPPQENQLH